MTVVYDYLQDAEAVVYGLEDGKTVGAAAGSTSVEIAL